MPHIKRVLVIVVLLSLCSKVNATQHWGGFDKGKCVAVGKRQWSARLWDIPPGLSWESACSNMPASIQGQYFSFPTSCVDKGTGGEWGEFDLNDASCTISPAQHWGEFEGHGCVGGKRRFSARLWG